MSKLLTSKAYIGLILVAVFLCGHKILAQDRFECSRTVWMLEEATERLLSMRINSSNNAIVLTDFVKDVEGRIDAIAFNHGDGLLYGIHSETWELYTISPTGIFQFVTTLNLSAGLSYESMTFNMDADQLVLVGSANGQDRSISIVDMRDNYTVQTTPVAGNVYATDYTVDPVTKLLYGLNSVDQNIFSLDLETMSFKTVAVRYDPANEFQGIYFDSFGELYAFGTTAGGVASALFRIDRNEMREKRLTTGPEAAIRDFANCPFRSDIRLSVDPKFSFPCNKVEYSCSISNSSGGNLEDLSFTGIFSPGFRIDNIAQNGLDGDFEKLDSRFMIRDLNLPEGVISFSVDIEIGDIFGGYYDAFGTMTGLPVFLGVEVDSDNPNTIHQGDKTTIEVRRLDTDSIFVSNFFCSDEEAFLDASIYGNNIQWQNGSSNSLLSVEENGIYILEAQSGCSSLTVVFDVTIARCPYNIELNHIVIPDTLFPCSESLMYFIIENDTGNEYEGIEFIDSFPAGFSLNSILKNPFGGEVEYNMDQGFLHIQNMTVPDGIDTIILSIFIGDLDPGAYGNRAIINNFPSDLGAFRLSDFPLTPQHDSTFTTILGVESDSNFIDKILCRGEYLALDGREYGTEFLWDNGSTDFSIEVNTPGQYELQIFSGCEVSYVFFDVNYGPDINIEISPVNYELHLGDSLQFLPQVYSENGFSELEWYDPQDSTISCHICLEPFVNPYFDNIYTLGATNGLCRDSIDLFVKVDKTRKIYAPNIFYPDDPGVNGLFFLQSPDFAYVEQIRIIDRWGRTAFEDSSFTIEGENGSWDGWTGNTWAEAGVYMWQASIRFLDNEVEVFSGTITLLD